MQKYSFFLKQVKVVKKTYLCTFIFQKETLSMQMRKLVFLSVTGEWGGSEELWFRCAKAALERGYLIGIMTYNYQLSDNQIAELRKYPNAKFFVKKKNSIFHRIINKFLPEKYKLHDTGNIVKWKPELVVITRGCSQGNEGIMSFLEKHNIKYCTVNHSALEHMWPSTKGALIIKHGFDHAVANYFVSNANLKLTQSQIGSPVEKSKIIRNPFNVPFNTNLDYPDESTIKLAFVSRYDFNKGYDVLFEVLSQQKWKERNIEVNLYGSGEHETGIKSLIHLFDLKNVFIRGYYSTIDIWKENHALILPSRFEGFPIVIVEAMLCARFAIATNVGGIKEAIVDNENGFIAESPRTEYLDAAMERAWARRSEWKAIGQQAQKYIKSLIPEFPVTIFLDELLSKIN